MNQFVLLGTTTDVPTRTRSSCYRGPKSQEITRSRVFQPVGKRPFVNSHQMARTRHRISKDGSLSWNWTAAELGADRAWQWFRAPKGLLQPAEQGARRALSMLRFGRAKSSSIASGLRDHSKVASFGRGICIAIGHGDLFTIEILHDDGGTA